MFIRDSGYTVRVFNLINPENSDSWNCLAEIEGQEIMAQLFCDVIIKNTGSPKGDHFWDNSEMNLLKALVLYVDQGFAPEGRNIGQVYKLLTMNSEKELNSLFDLLPVTHPAKAPYNIFKQASDTVRSGCLLYTSEISLPWNLWRRNPLTIPMEIMWSWTVFTLSLIHI